MVAIAVGTSTVAMKSEGNPPIFSGIFVIEKQVSRFASLLRAAQINVQRIASRPVDKKGLLKACHIGYRLCICFRHHAHAG
ncbi:hypothetical protein [Sphingobium sp. Leaf26]|uniref:hypothetical protein n=1 Tax=Sphingobium sp. Leaf26 TaxID=1735693 RepID=UPI00138F2213|nr:hypothetical protein [Sphingobium sp. Leaf26]